MDSVGEKLKRERELRGISLKEIADTTKINIRYLRALEEDKFDMLPGKFFIKSIIKTYADYIGLEQETILDHFHHTIQTKKQEKSEPIEKKVAPSEVPRKFKTLLRIASYSIIFIVVFIIIFCLIKGQRAVSVNEYTLTTDLMTSKKPTSSLLNTLIPQRRMLLQINFHQLTWIEIFSDGKLSFSGLKHPNELMTSTAKDEFIIHVGNAGGFTYSINGVPGKPLGKSGQVVKHLHITSQNYKQYWRKQLEIRSADTLSSLPSQKKINHRH
jgi:cytoskeletal protein RodZ